MLLHVLLSAEYTMPGKIGGCNTCVSFVITTCNNNTLKACITRDCNSTIMVTCSCFFVMRIVYVINGKDIYMYVALCVNYHYHKHYVYTMVIILF